MTDRLTVQQALIYAMICTSAVDNRMSDVELARIGWIVKELPAFESFNPDDLISEAQACSQIVSGPDGLETVLEMIAQTLPAHLRETVFILSAEIAASDRKANPEERRFLQLLAQRLNLDPLLVAALTRAAVARHYKA